MNLIFDASVKFSLSISADWFNSDSFIYDHMYRFEKMHRIFYLKIVLIIGKSLFQGVDPGYH